MSKNTKVWVSQGAEERQNELRPSWACEIRCSESLYVGDGITGINCGILRYIRSARHTGMNVIPASSHPLVQFVAVAVLDAE